MHVHTPTHTLSVYLYLRTCKHMKTCHTNVNTLLWPTSVALPYSRCYIRPRNQLTPISLERIGGICLYTNKRREGREINRLSKGSMGLNRWTLHHSLDLVAECLQNLRGLSTGYEPPDKVRQKTHVEDPWRAAAYGVTEFAVMTCGCCFHTTWYQLDNRSTWQTADTRDESGCQTRRLIAPSRVTYGARQAPPRSQRPERKSSVGEFLHLPRQTPQREREKKRSSPLRHTTLNIRRQTIPLHTCRMSSALRWIECARAVKWKGRPERSILLALQRYEKKRAAACLWPQGNPQYKVSAQKAAQYQTGKTAVDVQPSNGANLATQMWLHSQHYLQLAQGV